MSGGRDPMASLSRWIARASGQAPFGALRPPNAVLAAQDGVFEQVRAEEREPPAPEPDRWLAPSERTAVPLPRQHAHRSSACPPAAEAEAEAMGRPAPAGMPAEASVAVMRPAPVQPFDAHPIAPTPLFATMPRAMDCTAEPDGRTIAQPAAERSALHRPALLRPTPSASTAASSPLADANAAPRDEAPPADRRAAPHQTANPGGPPTEPRRIVIEIDRIELAPPHAPPLATAPPAPRRAVTLDSYRQDRREGRR